MIDTLLKIIDEFVKSDPKNLNYNASVEVIIANT